MSLIMNRPCEIERFRQVVGRCEIAEHVFSMVLFHDLLGNLVPKLCHSVIARRLFDEIVQEACQSMYRFLVQQRAADYLMAQDVESYLTRLICRHVRWARNAAIRRERRRRDSRSAAELMDQLPDRTFVSERQYSAAFHTAIATVLVMRTELRAAAWLKFFECWPATRIAEVLNVSEAKVSRLLDEARETVRLSLIDLNVDS